MTAPVTTDGIDSPVSEVGQWLATGLTFALALAAIAYVVRICVRDRIVWPAILLASGGLTCLMEPLFDHLYGLWFYEEGQWHLYTTFGSNQPIWVPAAYIAFYGGATVLISRTLARRPQMRTVWSLYSSIVAMAVIAEITYISILEVYCYQDRQPFVVLGYPIFLGFTNAMSAVVSGIVAYRLVPLLRGAAQLYLITLVPGAFAMGLFGTGILYLSVRHSENPSMILVSLAALTVAGGIAWTIRMLGRHLVDGQNPVDPALRPATHTADDERRTPVA
ncbi:hypothetical protein RD149_13570 [Gordonia westfalica]|uniref:Uncharacterized protein n=1 Tax=Gordonia westfalica TaxID=158898 RepID=A0ABU2GTL7_9ACTN|nr:hypothetical protein [Gordonia westfalica]MDS1114797.1 hypothetical protein [Gordonia westfalica]